MSPDALLKLPWQIQLALGSGYAAYLLCYAGIRAQHTTIDTMFSSLMFGLIATSIYYVLSPLSGEVLSSAAAFIAACFVGLFWRKLGRTWLKFLLYAANISWSDDDPSALATLLSNTKHRMTQVSVQLEDGTWLRCDDVSTFAKAPFGPCKIGPNGDVALYLTHEQPKEGEVKELKSVRDEDFGDRITYVPASKIKMINFRHQNIR